MSETVYLYDCCEHCEHNPDEVYPDEHENPCAEGCNDVGPIACTVVP